MIVRLIIFVGMVLGLLGFGVTAWVNRHVSRQPLSQAYVAPVTRTVLAVGHDVHAGTLLATGDLKAVSLAVDALPQRAIEDTQEARDNLFGSMVRRSLAANQPILDQDALRPGDHGFLAAVLGAGKIAVTVAVDAVSGSAGLIWPGDHVNLVLTQTRSDANLPEGRRVVAETLLSDVRVIAIDQHLMEGATGTKTQQPQAGTATLEVTPEQAEKVSVASRLGKLSLAVLSAAGGVMPASSGVTWAEDVSPALNRVPVAAPATPVATLAPPPPLRIFRGAVDAQEYRY